MSSLKIGGIVGTGGLGILAAGFLAAKVFNTGLEALFGVLLFVFVCAGAIALIARSL